MFLLAENNKGSHLTLDERCMIHAGILNGAPKSAIAQSIGKDKSTIGKEIKRHRTLQHKCHFPMECAAYRKCVHGRNCTPDCPDFLPFTCAKRDHSPGVCDGCARLGRCPFNRYTYSPVVAHTRYRETLIDARQGVDMTVSEAKEMANVIGPLLKQGLSPYQILKAHPELGISEKTLYNYIEGDIFHEVAGITVMDLRRQVSRKLPKKRANAYKKRADHKYLQGRTYKDYQDYMEHMPGVFVTQMDTVYNDVSNGPFIQTFKFIDAGLLFGILHPTKTAADMKAGVDLLEDILGPEVFRKYAHVLLTDRGSEFSDADAIETASDGTRRTRLFFCDPMRAGQKGSLENKHIELRYILPKGTGLAALGLTSQEALNLVLSHVNSAPVEKLGGKSPLELTNFLFHDLYQRLTAFGLQQIEKDRIILKPYLLKQ